MTGFDTAVVPVAVFARLGVAQADPPPDLGYQGRLLDASGAPLAGPAELEIRIFDQPAGGSELYAETHSGVALRDGVFHVLLGTGTNPRGTFDAALFAGTADANTAFANFSESSLEGADTSLGLLRRLVLGHSAPAAGESLSP